MTALGQAPSPRQLDVLKFIASEIERASLPPSLREIGLHLGIKSTNGVQDLINALVRKGLLIRQPRLSRALQLTDAGKGWIPGSTPAVVDGDPR